MFCVRFASAYPPFIDPWDGVMTSLDEELQLRITIALEWLTEVHLISFKNYIC